MGRLARLVLPVLLGLAVYYALFGGEYDLFEAREAKERLRREAAELARVRGRNDSLAARADSLETDPATLERLARERFGMIREGEVLYRFADPPDEATRGGRAPEPR